MDLPILVAVCPNSWTTMGCTEWISVSSTRLTNLIRDTSSLVIFSTSVTNFWSSIFEIINRKITIIVKWFCYSSQLSETLASSKLCLARLHNIDVRVKVVLYPFENLYIFKFLSILKHFRNDSTPLTDQEPRLPFSEAVPLKSRNTSLF